MPAISVVSPPTVLYDRDIIWPDWSDRVASGGGVSARTSLSSGEGNISGWGAVAGAGGSGAQVLSNGQYANYVASTGGGGIASRTMIYKAYLPLLRTLYAATGFQQPTVARLYRLQWTMQENVGALNFIFAGVGFCPEQGVEAGNPGTGGNLFFGIIGNGDGTWRWASRRIVGVPVQDSVPLGIVATQLHLFDLVLYGANSLGDAHLDLYVDGNLRLSRAWGAGTVLPDYSTPATATHFTVMQFAGDAAVATRLSLQHMRICMGQFTPEGTLV